MKTNKDDIKTQAFFWVIMLNVVFGFFKAVQTVNSMTAAAHATSLNIEAVESIREVQAAHNGGL